MTNLALPGNPRYQPKVLQRIFGYDNLVHTAIEVELAVLQVVHDRGFIPHKDYALLTKEVRDSLFTITTTQVDEVERAVTKHDVRALVRLMQERMPEPLRKWVHVPLTSYDVLDTAQTLRFLRAHNDVVRPMVYDVARAFRDQVRKYAKVVQIGRTHGKHALPITVGFWLATILQRILYVLDEMETHANKLVGKISGAVGAFNAQVGLGFSATSHGSDDSFEADVLTLLKLQPAMISTQILPPEPLAYYLFSCLLLSAVFGQFGRDGRNLMRSEIGEVLEPFEKGQVGSSTMAHKRNPITFEGLEGAYKKNEIEFGKVLQTLISEHQRDLTGSALYRDFPTLIVNLVYQMERLLGKGRADDRPFIKRIVVNDEALERNFALQGDSILAEPFYLLLQIAGFPGDAHDLINHTAMPLVGKEVGSLYEAVEFVAKENADLAKAWSNVPEATRQLLRFPANYTGLAAIKAEEICILADAQVGQV